MSIERARAYSERSHHYLANAAAMLRQQHPEKSSEFLWGAMAEALKAVAALKDIRLRTHAEISRYARDVAKQLSDERLLDAYSIAETLHSNFYEGMFEAGQVMRHSVAVREAVSTLLGLLPRNQVSQQERG